jgi:hypothetical protein
MRHLRLIPLADVQARAARAAEHAELNHRLRQVVGELAIDPLSLRRRPHPRPPNVLVPDHHVHEPVAVQIHQANAVVPAQRVSQRHAGREILRQPLARVAERQELDLLPVFRLGVVDQLDEHRR